MCFRHQATLQHFAIRTSLECTEFTDGNWNPQLPRYLPLMPNLKKLSVDSKYLSQLREMDKENKEKWEEVLTHLTELELLHVLLHHYEKYAKFLADRVPATIRITCICCQFIGNFKYEKELIGELINGIWNIFQNNSSLLAKQRMLFNFLSVYCSICFCSLLLFNLNFLIDIYFIVLIHSGRVNTIFCHVSGDYSGTYVRLGKRNQDPVTSWHPEFVHHALRAFEYPFQNFFGNLDLLFKTLSYIMENNLVNPNKVNR